MDLSIIVPLYNEEQSLRPLYQSIVNAIESLHLDYELLFVDDGSCDDTFAIASKLAAQNTRLKVLKFRRNYGQTPAMVAGIEHASGKVLVTMDGDLQNDPADIPRLVQEIQQGYDIVVGWRHQRKDKLLTRKIPSKIANWLIGKITGVPIKDNGCSLKAYRANVIKNIPLYSEMHRFIPAMTSIAGTKVAQIKVNHHARRYGVSKYGLSRVYRVLLDLLTIKTLLSVVSRPLMFFAWIAGVSGVIGAATLAAAVVQVLADPEQASVVFFGLGLLYITLSITLLFWGVISELVYRTGNVKQEQLAALTIDRVETMSDVNTLGSYG